MGFKVNNSDEGKGCRSIPIANSLPLGLDKSTRSFFIEAVRMFDGEQACSDEMTLVVVPSATADAFDKWLVDNEDTRWAGGLPPVYSKLKVGNLNPEPPPDAGRCDEWVEEIKDISKTNFHPGAVYEMRSHPDKNGYGHQATYDEFGILIKDGVGAGTADKVSPSILKLGGHFLEDARPYIWAAQLDGNPVASEIEVFDKDKFILSAPLLHQGDNLKKYIEKRPVNPSNIILEPGCCINENKEISCE